MLRNLFFSEFDIHKGPIISFIYPQEEDKTWENRIFQQFEHFKDIMIPCSEICFKSTVLEFDDHIFIVIWLLTEGYPVEIKNESYERIKLVYNCCFVVMKDKMPRMDDDKDQFFLEKNCEKLAIYLMEFEQKYQIITNQSKREMLVSILRTISMNLSMDKKCTIRMLEDIICLDLMSTFHSTSSEQWKRRSKFRIPVLK